MTVEEKASAAVPGPGIKAKMEIAYSPPSRRGKHVWRLVYVGRRTPPVSQAEIEIMASHLAEVSKAENDNAPEISGVI